MEQIDYTIHSQGGDSDKNPRVVLTGREAEDVKASIRNGKKMDNMLGFHDRLGITVHAIKGD